MASHPFHLPWTADLVHESRKRQIEPLSLGTNITLRTGGGGVSAVVTMHAPLVFLYFVCHR